MYSKGPSAAEAAQWGLTLEEAQGPPVEIWPDNLVAIRLFESMSTQWRTGFKGAYGLDYNVLYRKMDRMHLSAEEFDDIESAIGIMEQAALEKMHEND